MFLCMYNGRVTIGDLLFLRGVEGRLRVHETEAEMKPVHKLSPPPTPASCHCQVFRISLMQTSSLSSLMDIEVDHRWRDAQEKITDSPQTTAARPLPTGDDVAWKPTASVSPAKKRWSSAFWVSTALAVGIALAVIALG